MTAPYHHPSRIKELESVSIDDLEATPGLGEALFAHALAGDKDLRKHTRALIRATKHPIWTALVKEFTKRDYGKAKHENEYLADDLEAFAALEGVDATLVAYHLHRGYRFGTATAYVMANLSDVTIGLEIDYEVERIAQWNKTTLRLDHAWPASVFDHLARHPQLTGIQVKLAEPEPLPASVLGLTQLEILVVYGPVTGLPEGMFSSLTDLRRLNFYGAKLERLPADIADSKLTDLSITQLACGPDLLFEIATLESVSIGGCDDATFPDRLTAWPNLKTLILSGSGIETLPPSFGSLSSLETLALRGLALRELPEQLGNLTSLKSLELSGLALRELPERLGELASLEKLRLDKLKLDSLPSSTGALSSLRELTICATHIERMPAGLSALEAHVSLLSEPTFGPLNAEAARVLKRPSTAVLLDVLRGYLVFSGRNHFASLAPFASALASFAETSDPRAAKITELLLAVSRLFYDDEHGRLTNNYIFEQFEQYGDDLDKRAHAALKLKSISKSTRLGDHLGGLHELEGFDVDAFVEFVEAGLSLQ